MPMDAFGAGFAFSLSLILAIGAQNAFVLKQGLRGEHVFWICLFCAFSDAVLILAGVAGFALLGDIFPAVVPWMRYGGAVFLIWYGARSFRAAWKGGAALVPTGEGPRRLGPVLGICAVLTWGNPHVYLDTLALIGSVSTRYGGARYVFASGAMLASFLFFFILGYGAALLRPLFATTTAWRLLEAGIGMVMWFIAVGLLWEM